MMNDMVQISHFIPEVKDRCYINSKGEPLQAFGGKNK